MLEVLARAIRQLKETKRIQIGKEAKVSLFADDMTVCTGGSKIPPRSPIADNTFSKVTKLTHKKSVALQYTNVKQTEKHIIETRCARAMVAQILWKKSANI